MVVVVLVARPIPHMTVESPLCGRVDGPVTAQVPLTRHVGAVVEPVQVLGQKPELEGEGVGGGSHQDTALETYSHTYMLRWES